MLDCARRFYSIAFLQATVQQMALYGFNELHLHLSDNEALSIESSTVPGAVSSSHYTKAQMSALVTYAAGYGIRDYPRDRHARPYGGDPVASAGGYSGLALTTPSTGSISMDLSQPGAIPLGLALLAEYIPVFPAKNWVIGGDEWMSGSDASSFPQLLTAAPAQFGGSATIRDLEYYFYNQMAAYLIGQGRTPHIWDDQLVTPSDIVTPNTAVIIDVWYGNSAPATLQSDGYTLVNSNWNFLYAYTYANSYPTASSLAGFTDDDFANGGSGEQTLSGAFGVQLAAWSQAGDTYTESQVAAGLYPAMAALANELDIQAPLPLPRSVIQHSPAARARLGPRFRPQGGIASSVVTPPGAPARPRPFAARNAVRARARIGNNLACGDGNLAALSPGAPAPPAARPFVARRQAPARARCGSNLACGDGILALSPAAAPGLALPPLYATIPGPAHARVGPAGSIGAGVAAPPAPPRRPVPPAPVRVAQPCGGESHARRRTAASRRDRVPQRHPARHAGAAETVRVPQPAAGPRTPRQQCPRGRRRCVAGRHAARLAVLTRAPSGHPASPAPAGRVARAGHAELPGPRHAIPGPPVRFPPPAARPRPRRKQPGSRCGYRQQQRHPAGLAWPAAPVRVAQPRTRTRPPRQQPRLRRRPRQQHRHPARQHRPTAPVRRPQGPAAR